MKSSAGLLALTLIALVGCRSNGSAQGLNSLRVIKIETHTMLMLGGKVPSDADFCDWNGATCDLKAGTFGGTKEMSLSKTQSGLISQFHFNYGVVSVDAVRAQIDDFTRRLGKPTQDSTSKSGQFDTRELKWSDSATTFEYFYRTDGGQAEASATLLDNALAGPVY